MLREQREYEENLRIIKEGLEREKQSDCTKQKKREYCELIKDQMRIKEEQRRLARRKSEEELGNRRNEELQRKAKIDQVLEDKIKQLKLSHVPDNLLKDVERRIKRVTSS